MKPRIWTRTTYRYASTMSNRDSQTVLLPDGRTLSFAEYGHSNGYPLLFFHGYPSSRLEARGIDNLAHRRRLRLIALERPGFGLSTFQPHRHILDWPNDVQAFVEHAGLKRFAVLGLSGGGPYALACAYKLPRDMMSAVGMMASAGPWKAGMHELPWYTWVNYFGATYWPTVHRVVADALVCMLRWVVTTGPVTRWIDKTLKGLKQKDKQEKEQALAGEAEEPISERRDRALRILFEGFAQGVQGAVQEAQLLSSQDWGFRFEDVDYDKVQIWHGTQDKNAPVHMMRYLAERLPHCVLREYENDTHFTMGDHLEEIVEDLVPEKIVEEFFMGKESVEDIEEMRLGNSAHEGRKPFSSSADENL